MLTYFIDEGQGALAVPDTPAYMCTSLRPDTHSHIRAHKHTIGRQVWPVRDLVLWFTIGGQREGIYSSFVAAAHNDLKVTGWHK